MNAADPASKSQPPPQIRQTVSPREDDANIEEVPTFHFHRFRVKLSVPEPEIPQDFLEALADYQAGRVVDMATALSDEPTC